MAPGGRVTFQVSMRRRFVEVRMAPIDIGWNEVFNGYYDLRCCLMVFNVFFLMWLRCGSTGLKDW